MTIERAKQLLFCTIQLLRQERMHAFSDWKDADDELFSDLDIEIGELEDIYDPYGIMVYGGSCFENGQSPKDYDVRYYCERNEGS